MEFVTVSDYYWSKRTLRRTKWARHKSKKQLTKLLLVERKLFFPFSLIAVTDHRFSTTDYPVKLYQAVHFQIYFLPVRKKSCSCLLQKNVQYFFDRNLSPKSHVLSDERKTSEQTTLTYIRHSFAVRTCGINNNDSVPVHLWIHYHQQ